MSRIGRAEKIKAIEKLRGSKVICYLTSIRPGAEGLIADEAVREIIDHLQRGDHPKFEKISLFLVSNGGDSVVPWRLIPIFRELAKKFEVLIPYKAFSAATIMALGADEIVMHKYAALGPIDPTVTNEFNPIETGTNRKLGISVEDVKAYISFIKETVGIKHEDELVRTVEILANKIHPLALGNVERFISQSRMIARKLLLLHTEKQDEHNLDGIIEALASKLYFHGHPINRIEAKELGLKVAATVDPILEDLMWSLFVEFENDLKFRVRFDPVAQLFSLADMSKAQPGHFTEVARYEEDITWSIIETEQLCSRLETKLRYTMVADPQLQTSISTTPLSQRWSQA